MSEQLKPRCFEPELQHSLPANPLLIGSGTALIVFGLLDLLPDHTQRFLQKTEWRVRSQIP